MLNVLAEYPPCHFVGFAGVAFLVTVISLLGLGAGFGALESLHHHLTRSRSLLVSGLSSVGIALVVGDLWWNGASIVASSMMLSKMPVLATGFTLIALFMALFCEFLYRFFAKSKC